MSSLLQNALQRIKRDTFLGGLWKYTMGGVLGLSLLLGASYFLYMHWNRKKQQKAEEEKKKLSAEET
ncbi:hypothetical protein FKM82_003162 [Ascaphus truei]